MHAVAIGKPGTSTPALTSPGDFTIHDIAQDGRWLATREDIRLGVGARLAGETTDRDLSWLNQNWSPTLSRDGARILFSDGTTGGNYGVAGKDGRFAIVRLGEVIVVDVPDETWALGRPSRSRSSALSEGAGEPVRLKRGPSQV